MARHFTGVQSKTARQIIVQRVQAVQTSCGSGVPLYEYVGQREQLAKWAREEAAKGTLDDYIRKNSARSDEKFPLNTV